MRENENELATWLMRAESPSIRYRTLVDLFGLSENDAGVIQSQQAIMEEGAVPAILSRQTTAGTWTGERSYYTPKYTSTHWNLMLLAELGVDGHDSRFQRGVRYMLTVTADELNHQMKTHTTGLSCFWGNLLRYALQSGLYDAQIKQIIAYTVMALQDGPCLCSHNGGTACAWGIVRTLWGLAAVPKEFLRHEIKDAIDQGVWFLLESFHVLEANYPSEKGKTSPLWFKLSFPLFYQADILFVLRILDELDMLYHPGAQSALDWLEQLRDRNGRWRGSSPFRQRTWHELGDREETDRWVSLHASRVLRHAGRQ